MAGGRREGTGSGSGRALVVTADDALLDDVLRLAAVAGTEVEVADSAAGSRLSWADAPLVLVGTDLAQSCAAAGLPRRADTVLVGRDLDDATVWRRAVEVGASDVIFLPDAESWLVNLLANVTERADAPGMVVAVVGGRGGAGASVLAAALAMTGLRLGHRTMLVDADPLGGGIDLVLGGEDRSGLRWPELAASRGRVSSPALMEALPQVDELTVLSWDRGDAVSIPAAAMTALLEAAQRGSDLVVVDLPRHFDEAAEEVLRRASVGLIVVPAEVRACAAAARVAAAAARHCADVEVVVRGPAPAGLSATTVAAALGLRLAGELRPEPRLAMSLERGEPPGRRGKGPLSEFAAAFVGELLSAVAGRRAVA